MDKIPQTAGKSGEIPVSRVLKRKDKERVFSKDSALRLFVVVTVTVFFAEFFVMIVFFNDQFQMNLGEVLLDPAMMVLISFPVLYFFFLNPLQRIILEKSAAEKELEQINNELESRVEQRTQELNLVNQSLNSEVEQRKKLQDDLELRVEERTRELSNEIQERRQVEIQLERVNQTLQDSLESERRTRDELIRSEKLAGMGRTIASVAHELNNPIQTIKNCVFLIRGSLDESALNGDSKEMLDILSNESQRIADLVSQLRDFIRPNLNVTFTGVSLPNLVGEVKLSLEVEMRQANIGWRLEQEEGVFKVFGAPDQLKQVFINLFQNAIDVMPSGGRLEVSLRRLEDPPMMEIAVVDTGPGIPEEDLAKIFEPFFSTKPKGMGLGLPIVYQIVQRHGGQIDVSSTPGVGTTFAVRLPAVNI